MLMLFDETAWNFLDRHLAPCLLSLYSPDLSTCPPVHTYPLLSTYPISPRLCAPQPHHTPHIPQSCLFPLFSPFQCPCPLPSLPALCPHIQPPLSLTEDICTERGTLVQETKAHDAEDYTRWSTRMEQIMAIHETANTTLHQNPLSQTHSNPLLHSPLVSRPTRWSLWYWYLDVYVDHLYIYISIYISKSKWQRNVVQRCASKIKAV